MFYSTDKNDHGLPHDPFKAIVAPRPIGWITSMSASGAINLAPYSLLQWRASNAAHGDVRERRRERIRWPSSKRRRNSSAISRPGICASR